MGSTQTVAPAVSEAERKIGQQVLVAVNEAIRRAHAAGKGEPLIADRKPKSPASGTLQDCEFGLMVLTAHRWLSSRGLSSGELAETKKVAGLLTALASRIVHRLTVQDRKEFSGGELENSLVFFTGDPYTVWAHRTSSAHLDAAMLVTAFLSAALEDLGTDLQKARFLATPDLVRQGIESLPDAALYVCVQGLQYAVSCRTIGPDGFAGFSCDPASARQKSDEPGVLGALKDYDRLFFTWTTCETIHELRGWDLDEVAKTVTAHRLIDEAKALRSALVDDLKLASRWCRETFLDGFRALEPLPVSQLVIEIGNLPPGAPPTGKVESLAAYVRHVYYISQYAAIRSIEPEGIDLAEVGSILNILDSLVGEQILNSGLDKAPHPLLSDTLTNQYHLGLSNPNPYKDDAYFPLVVRSVSGLLSRTITKLDTLATRDEVQRLVIEFRRSLADRYQRLVNRRPEPNEPGDEALWSYAEGFPYVLYATQRTVFGLLEYAEFLNTMEEFERTAARPVASAEIQQQIHQILAEQLAKVLIGPVTDSLVRTLSSLLPADGQQSSSVAPTADQSLLPSPDWARAPLFALLEEFNREFLHYKLEGRIEQLANHLVDIRATVQLSQQRRSPKSATGIERVHAPLRDAMNGIVNFPGLPELRVLQDEGRWDAASLRPVLCEYMFRQFINNGRSLADLVTDGNAFPGQVKAAIGLISLMNKESTAS
jgi:hypothetical protein